VERALGVTWGELVGLEPRLEELLRQARADGARCRDRADLERIFAPLRDAVTELVGFRGRHHDHPVLGSVGAYEVAYWRLRDAVAGLLPPPAAGVQDAWEATTEPRAQGCDGRALGSADDATAQEARRSDFLSAAPEAWPNPRELAREGLIRQDRHVAR
jgi:hypothetical protein